MSESIGDDKAEGLGAIYPEAWFRARDRYRAPYHAFAEAIREVFAPLSLVDIGCGAGYILEAFESQIPVLGIDGSLAAIRRQEPHGRNLLCHDLCNRPDEMDVLQLGLYEFAVSIEVAEHIPEPFVNDYLAWFGGCRRALVTAAPPGQRGNHHVNCQPRSYWIEKFGRRGFEHSPDDTYDWQLAARKRTKGCPWVVKNAMVFGRVMA